MSEHAGGERRFSVERIKAPTRADGHAILRMHSALHPHTLLERFFSGASHDISLDELEKMDGVFVARDEAGRAVGALTVARAEDGWTIHHAQTNSHDASVLAGLLDKALDFARERGAREIAVRVSERAAAFIAALREKQFRQFEGGETHLYRRYL